MQKQFVKGKIYNFRGDGTPKDFYLCVHVDEKTVTFIQGSKLCKKTGQVLFTKYAHIITTKIACPKTIQKARIMRGKDTGNWWFLHADSHKQKEYIELWSL